MDISRAENLVATRVSKTFVNIPASSQVSRLNPSGCLNFAVTAIDRYGHESDAVQLLLNAGPTYSAPIIANTDGRPVRLPRYSALDADFVLVETMTGTPVATRPYGPTISVEGIPPGMYQLRTLGRKGRNHRIGFFRVLQH